MSVLSIEASIHGVDCGRPEDNTKFLPGGLFLQGNETGLVRQQMTLGKRVGTEENFAIAAGDVDVIDGRLVSDERGQHQMQRGILLQGARHSIIQCGGIVGR